MPTEETRAQAFVDAIVLATSLAVGFLVSLGSAILAMRIAVGRYGLQDGMLGVSPGNMGIVAFAAMLFVLMTSFAVVGVFMMTRSTARWLTLVPALILPPMTSIGFGLLLIYGAGA